MYRVLNDMFSFLNTVFVFLELKFESKISFFTQLFILEINLTERVRYEKIKTDIILIE
jgi:hypothetical protein